MQHAQQFSEARHVLLRVAAIALQATQTRHPLRAEISDRGCSDVRAREVSNAKARDVIECEIDCGGESECLLTAQHLFAETVDQFSELALQFFVVL
jgi:hypothetical protein